MAKRHPHKPASSLHNRPTANRRGAPFRRLRLEPLEPRHLLAGVPQLVYDINQTPTGGFAQYGFQFASIDNRLYFTVDDGPHGPELWTSDGTPEGTKMVKEIRPGDADTFIQFLTGFNGEVYFAAEDGIHGVELWKTNGTESGTVLVKDIGQGGNSSNPSQLTEFNGALFFVARDGNGYELWKTNGTELGTVRVKDIRPGAGGAFLPFNYDPDLTVSGGKLFFVADDGTTGYNLWVSNGTAAGTVRLADLWPGSNSYQAIPNYLTDVNGALYFSARDEAGGREIWKSNGTPAGTTRMTDLVAGVGSSNPRSLTNVNGALFFSFGGELWKSNGAAAGTAMVKDIRPGPGSSYVNNLTNVNGTLYLIANDGTTGFELWKSNGTAAGTTRVADIRPGSASAFSESSFTSTFTVLGNVDGTLFFTADDGVNGYRLWKSDGTVNGTVLADYVPHQSANGTVYFGKNAAGHTALFRTDGTVEGTTLVKDIGSQTASSAYASNVLNYSGSMALDGQLFFMANDGTNIGLWKSDGSTAGTVKVKDLRPPTTNGYLYKPRPLFTNANGTLFFVANDMVNGRELWKSDGTADGTVMVKDIRPGSGASNPENFMIVGGVLYFTAEDASNGRELWKSDGTAAGTVMVKNIRQGSASSNTGLGLDINGTLYFRADDGINGPGIWKSDGTAEGTVLAIPSGSVDLRVVAYFNGAIYLVEDGYLMKSDGTRAGTIMVTDVASGREFSPYTALNVGDTLFLLGHTPNLGVAWRGKELWRLNESGSSVVLVKDIWPGASSSTPSYLTSVDGTLYFSAEDGQRGRELWKTDGTTAGTVLVKDIRPGNAYSYSRPAAFTNVNGVVYFAAEDGKDGRELWKTDGTTAGTVMVADLRPGINGSDPRSLQNINGVLFFMAEHAVYGRELWKLNTRPTSVVGRRVFYNDSEMDGYNSTANADDDWAIAVDKVALLPGGTAGPANVTNRGGGLNGVMVDVDNLMSASLTAADFEFRVGNTLDPDDWSLAPAPAEITVRREAGVGGTDRVTIVWANGAIRNQWLQVTVKATANTGLAQSDVFYFGHVDGLDGDLDGDDAVGLADLARMRRAFGSPATGGTARGDANVDGQIDRVDITLSIRSYATTADDQQLSQRLATLVAPTNPPGSAPAQATVAARDRVLSAWREDFLPSRRARRALQRGPSPATGPLPGLGFSALGVRGGRLQTRS